MQMSIVILLSKGHRFFILIDSSFYSFYENNSSEIIGDELFV